MNLIKTIIALILLGTTIVYAQDTTQTHKKQPVFIAIETQPQYPGGIQSFANYIGSSLKYPKVAQLIGLEGKVYVSFVVERDGSIVDTKPVRCLGAGCESEAVRVISGSKPWKPGMQDGKPVRVAYTVPINFSFPNGKKTSVKIKDLVKSEYGFVINVDNKIYSLNEAEKTFGKTIDPQKIISADQVFDPAYAMPGKTEVYMIIMHS